MNQGGSADRQAGCDFDIDLVYITLILLLLSLLAWVTSRGEFVVHSSYEIITLEVTNPLEHV